MEHLDRLTPLVEHTYFKNGGDLTIRQYKNIMSYVFEQGAKSDDTINDDICFETIKLKDVIK